MADPTTLILGGTSFVGRHLAGVALARGHRVTLFNRGTTNPDIFPDVERVRGDRRTDLGLLEGRKFDLVIDTSAYVPSVVRASTVALGPSCGLYVFVSTVSVYADSPAPELDEDSPLHAPPAEGDETFSSKTYGPLKVACEAVVQEVVPDRALVLRPCVVAGPHDPTDRFTYWVRRLPLGGEVLAPGAPDHEVQFIDGRDLAVFALNLAQARTRGTFNVVGPGRRTSMYDLLEACRPGAETGANLIWVDDDFLLAEGVVPFSELPFWIPVAEGPRTFSGARARAAGLRCRGVGETAADTRSWLDSDPDGFKARAGLSAEREAELLQRWHARTQ